MQSAKDLRLGRRFIFQQDNDPKHTARATKEWFGLKNVNVLKWPSQSPDLNPIENLWQDLKIAVHRRSQSNLTELHLFCQEEWTNLSISRCAKLLHCRNTSGYGVATLEGGDRGSNTEKSRASQYDRYGLPLREFVECDVVQVAGGVAGWWLLQDEAHMPPIHLIIPAI
ncbi:unnamed protein product [Pleuronectes platessa]|uniref:Tc1-like transposase DDE domain-containing protein n=1 Tax=Pleuronectes platessa TaxID=8262 RepID=A0A9N7Z7Q0_PLEPL|nr:unnamed protein product [Pleuronectes platessa]